MFTLLILDTNNTRLKKLAACLQHDDLTLRIPAQPKDGIEAILESRPSMALCYAAPASDVALYLLAKLHTLDMKLPVILYRDLPPKEEERLEACRLGAWDFIGVEQPGALLSAIDQALGTQLSQ